MSSNQIKLLFIGYFIINLIQYLFHFICTLKIAYILIKVGEKWRGVRKRNKLREAKVKYEEANEEKYAVVPRLPWEFWPEK